jgi:hypothetical protein
LKKRRNPVKIRLEEVVEEGKQFGKPVSNTQVVIEREVRGEKIDHLRQLSANVQRYI